MRAGISGLPGSMGPLGTLISSWGPYEGSLLPSRVAAGELEVRVVG